MCVVAAMSLKPMICTLIRPKYGVDHPPLRYLLTVSLPSYAHSSHSDIPSPSDCLPFRLAMPFYPLRAMIPSNGSKAPRDTYSVLERVMWCARPTHFREGQQLNVIPKPEECDHSPVKLPPFSNNKRYHQQAGGGKRGRRKKVHGQARAAGTEVCQNQQQQDDHQQQRQQQQQLPPQQPQPGTVGHCSDSEVTDHAMVGHQPDAAAGRPDAREDDTLNMPDSICAASDFGDECALNEAVEEESDAAVMAAMGFDGFGSSRG